ncbi:MAG: hypothetical protein HWE20_13590 [Gammaproteobacteria bacterium]|nr:hypothetical protein [Gammaproteobacteria bacterium]
MRRIFAQAIAVFELAEAKQNVASLASVDHWWAMHEQSELWRRFHNRITDNSYTRAWMNEHLES